ncbi:MAG: EamA family transporter RarD [Lysobacter sp.]|nr:EamA family transporter RarD [Lysobacter sp.]
MGGNDERRGLTAAIASFLLWGAMPLYWHLLKSVPALQILLHRVVWSTLLVGGWLLWREGHAWLRVLARLRVAGMLAASGLLIGANWGLYIWSVNNGHVVESSLGYFINPLLSVLLGVAFLRERLTRAQWASVAVATLGVLWLTLRFGQLPWIALALAVTFALYGLIRKLVAVDAMAGLAIEGGYLLLPALAVLGWSELHGAGGFLALGGSGYGATRDVLLVASGALTALPLIGFAYGVRRVPLSVIGLLQYISPTLQFLIGVFAFHETFDRDRAIGFAFIWTALAMFALDGWRRSRRAAVRVGAAVVEAD